MGNKFFGVPPNLTRGLQKAYNLRYFVETGTYRAGTAIWAADLFEEVYTIENGQSPYEFSKEKVKPYPNIHLLFGDSEKILPVILGLIDERALFWLDAHNTKKHEREPSCALMAELKAIREDGREHIVLIDDAHFFIEKKPLYPGWPILKDIITALPEHNVEVHKFDIIIATPVQ